MSADENLRMKKTDITPDEIKRLSRKLDILLQAISISHIKEAGTDKCVQNCWACKMEESLKAMEMADRMKD
jgi:hypothetical protein